mgnify:CR=1 FL=1
MPIIKNNFTYDKTSFLSKSNSAFIEDMYIKYVEGDSELPKGWKEFFEGLGEEKKVILNEVYGPSWAPKKKSISKIIDYGKAVIKDDRYKDEDAINGSLHAQKNYEKEKEQSVKAIALIRAYRIRGHLIANLDPLGLMERKYQNELCRPNGYKSLEKKLYLLVN